MAFRSYIHQFRTQGKTSFPVQTSFRTPSNYPVLFRSVCGTFVRKASAIAHVWDRQPCSAWRLEWPRTAARTHWCFSLIWDPVNDVRTLGNNGTGRNGRAVAVAVGSLYSSIQFIFISCHNKMLVCTGTETFGRKFSGVFAPQKKEVVVIDCKKIFCFIYSVLGCIT